ncbi:MAG: OmpH family outer membrane protein [Fimbriimonadales bacterium]|nr:OmpH family outer membrane protein [Fimbriimonadales bacterium]
MNQKKTLAIALTTLGAFLAVILTLASQAPQMKFGVVDMSQVADSSKLGQKRKKEFEELRARMMALMQFVDDNPAMTASEANRLRQLMLANTRSANEETELNNLQTTIRARTQELFTLSAKQPLTEAEQSRFRELSEMARDSRGRLQQWNEDLFNQISTLREASRNEVLEKVRAAVNKVAKRDGYTIVFDKGVAPYAANDLTDAAIKQMDTDNP